MSVSKSESLSQNSRSNPKLIILDMYDRLVNFIEIDVETILSKHAEDDPFVDRITEDKKQQVNKRHGYKTVSMFDRLEGEMFVDSNKKEYDVMDAGFKTSQAVNIKTVHEYVNKMRQEMIDELRNSQGKALEMYDTLKRNTDQARNIIENESTPNQVDLKTVIGKNFCFILYKIAYYNIKLLYYNFLTLFLKEALLARAIYAYINQLFKDLAFGHHVFRLPMSEIQKINKLKLDFTYMCGQNLGRMSNLHVSKQISSLKSLGILVSKILF